jgi:hypothetical protein
MLLAMKVALLALNFSITDSFPTKELRLTDSFRHSLQVDGCHGLSKDGSNKLSTVQRGSGVD